MRKKQVVSYVALYFVSTEVEKHKVLIGDVARQVKCEPEEIEGYIIKSIASNEYCEDVYDVVVGMIAVMLRRRKEGKIKKRELWRAIDTVVQIPSTFISTFMGHRCLKRLGMKAVDLFEIVMVANIPFGFVLDNVYRFLNKYEDFMKDIDTYLRCWMILARHGAFNEDTLTDFQSDYCPLVDKPTTLVGKEVYIEGDSRRWLCLRKGPKMSYVMPVDNEELITLVESDKLKIAESASTSDTARDVSDIKDVLDKQNAYVVATVEGDGCHIGRLKGISLDANGDLVIEVDISSISCTK